MEDNGQDMRAEPWELLIDQHGKVVEGVKRVPDGFHAPHRRTIKTLENAPHVVFVMPVGNKEAKEVWIDPEKKERRIMPGYMYPGLVPAELMACRDQVAIPPNVSTSWMIMKNNISAVLRDIMTEQAIQRNANFIFYWDDDVMPPADVIYKMLNHMAQYPDIGAITGVVWTKAIPTEPLVYKDPHRGAYWGFNTDPAAEPEDIHAAGAGCLMARVQAIKKMEKPHWFDQYTISEGGRKQGIAGHDIRFCRKMRDETGYRVTVDGSIQCKHFDYRNQLVFGMPDNMPAMQDARDMADQHVRATDEEKTAIPEGPDLSEPRETAGTPSVQKIPGDDEYVEPIDVVPDASIEHIKKQAGIEV